MDNPFKSPNVLSLCTGMRGIERGIERAIGKLNVVSYVEIEAFIIYNLVRQMEQGMVDAAPVWSNIKTFPSAEFHNKIHGITGGYPCQPFSTAGKRNGEKDERHLWPYIERIINAVRPVWCFFENVDDHITLGFDTVYKSLRNMGYTVEAGIYSAEEVGAPHERQRIFILAMDYTYCNRFKQEYQICTGWHSIKPASKELANTWSKRGQLQDNRKQPAKQFIGWPAAQGSSQYEYEEPRRIEPGMGCTVNGYNFRNDLLRMYGNGVVEQTAELAFIDLLNKFLKNT